MTARNRATLRTVSFVLPEFTNDGRTADPAHEYAERMLLDRFGGYSESNIKGAWKDADGNTYTDFSIKYECAIDASVPLNYQAFREIAFEAGKKAEQLAVMVTGPYGDVSFLDIENASAVLDIVLAANDNTRKQEVMQ